MPEPEIGDSRDGAPALHHGKIRIEGDLSQHHHNAKIPQQVQFAFKEGPAVAQLYRQRFVSGWRAVDRGRDPCIMQLETIFRTLALRLRRESGVVQRTIQEVAGTISREHTSSTIGAMCSGSEAENQQARGRVAERRYWFSPIFPFEECPAFRRRHFAAVPDQTGATPAVNNFPVQRGKVLFITFGDFKWSRH